MQPRTGPCEPSPMNDDFPILAAVAARTQRIRVGTYIIPVSYTHLTPADERSSVDLGGRRIIKKKKEKICSGPWRIRTDDVASI